jgi:hypothetical protein
MMSNTLGAPFGGTTRGGHQACDSEACSLITPPNFGSGGGSCSPLSVVVAVGEPGTPVICWAMTGLPATTARNSNPATIGDNVRHFMTVCSWFRSWHDLKLQSPLDGRPRGEDSRAQTPTANRHPSRAAYRSDAATRL